MGFSPTRNTRATWPGDRLLARPDYVWTNAVTIERPAEQVWPWLVQLGQGRGGLYSYDWLENLVGCDIHSADRILPQFQQPLPVGDRVIRMARYAPFNPVARFERVARSSGPPPPKPPGSGAPYPHRMTRPDPGPSTG